MTLYQFRGIAPQLPDDPAEYWLAPSAVLIGDVRIARKVIILFGAAIRGDNEPISIGEGSNIQENCVLHTDPGIPMNIGKGCTIGHGVILHGCTIGDNSLIGMGATVLNGAKIGPNCLIGAGAVITENKVIPEGSLVIGTPGKVIRQLDERALQSMRATALKYQSNITDFHADLKPI